MRLTPSVTYHQYRIMQGSKHHTWITTNGSQCVHNTIRLTQASQHYQRLTQRSHKLTNTVSGQHNAQKHHQRLTQCLQHRPLGHTLPTTPTVVPLLFTPPLEFYTPENTTAASHGPCNSTGNFLSNLSATGDGVSIVRVKGEEKKKL